MNNIGICVDVSNHETRIVVTSPAGVVHSQVLPIAGNAIDKAIAQYLEQKYELLVGRRTAEILKSEFGTVASLGRRLPVEVRGRRLSSDALETVCVTYQDVHEALAVIMRTIIEGVKEAVNAIPAEVSSVIASRGIVLKGVDGLPRNMDEQLAEATGMAVRRTETVKIKVRQSSSGILNAGK